MDILSIENYSDARQFFFKELTSKLTDAIQSSDYSTEQPLDELLKKFDDKMLLCYIWKDTYLRAYVFDKDDQRRELMRSYQYAQKIVNDEELKQLYISAHDEFVKNEDAKTRLDITTILGV